jgi:hypothetical protein
MQLAWATTRAKKVADVFLLREPAKRVAGRSAVQQENTARYHAAALRRIRGARELTHSDPVATIALYREAAVLLIAALSQSSHAEEVAIPSSVAEAWRELDRLSPLTHAKVPADLSRAREILGSDDPLSPDALAPADVGGIASAAAETVDWLSSAIEPRSARELVVASRVRIVSGVLMALFALYVVWDSIFAPKNIALNKPAIASSQRPGTGPASGVDNGEIELSYGVHTNVENTPWVRIDLGASVPVHEVRVYNRGDGYQSEIVPLAIQLSDDDSSYADVAQRTDPFTREQPWIAKLEGKRARFVRVFMPRHGYIALSEIEVY